MNKRRKKIIIVLIVLAVLIIPFTGITLAAKGPAFFLSLSRIAGDGKHFWHLFVFGNFVIIFILLSVYYLYQYYKLGNKRIMILFLIACCLLEATVLTPYIPKENIVISKIHNLFAYVSISLLVISLFGLIFTIPNFSRRVFVYTSISFVFIVIVCLTIFILTGNPSSFFELTLITLLINLILFIIIMLHHNETNKINGTLGVRYNIIKHKPFKIILFKARNENKEPSPIIIHKSNLYWKKLEPKSKLNPFRKVFVYYENKNKTYQIGLLTKKKNQDKRCKTFNYKNWVVFYLDDTLESTKVQTLHFIKEKFSLENEYEFVGNIYLEKYYVTKNENIRKCEIWIPIQKKNKT